MKSIKMSLITVALLAVCGAASAQTSRAINSDGYLTDSRGNVVKNSTGLCVQTSSYKAGVTFHPDCDQAPVSIGPGTQVAPTAPTMVPVTPVTPVVPVTPVAPVMQSVTKNLQAEVLFNFDSETLNASGKQKLDQLLQDLKSTNVNDVIVTGYTDPIGTDAYNIGLSQRRANAVQKYLAAGVSQNAMKTVAKGESELKINTCGDKETKKSIACNAPNRRVEVIVHGTQSK